MEFNEILRNLRKDKGVTQQAVADAIGVRQSNYAFYETGKKHPSHETLLAIADYYGVTSDYLLGRTQSPNHVKVDSDDFDLLVLTKEKAASGGLSKDDMVKIIQVLTEALAKNKQ